MLNEFFIKIKQKLIILLYRSGSNLISLAPARTSQYTRLITVFPTEAWMIVGASILASIVTFSLLKKESLWIVIRKRIRPDPIDDIFLQKCVPVGKIKSLTFGQSFFSALNRFSFILQVYEGSHETSHLVRPSLATSDVIIKTVSSVTEPDRFTIFTGWSTGKETQKKRHERMFSSRTKNKFAKG